MYVSLLGDCFCILLLGSKYFPDHRLPENVVATTDAKSALLGADYCLHAVPVQVVSFCWLFFTLPSLHISIERK